MQIDLFMEFAAPAFAGKSDAQVFEEGISVAKVADTGGFGAVWLAEHHFLEEYSLSSAPEMLLSAIARETQSLGLGFGIIPLPIHDPLRVAERLATLDILSNGRVQWGVGRGVTKTELNGFGVDSSETREIFRTNLARLREFLRTGYHTKGDEKFALQPRPGSTLQNGWMAAVSPESYDLAAGLGLDVMAGPFKPWQMVRADLKRYRRLRPDGRSSFTLAAYCEEDHAAARARAEKGLVWAFRRILEITRPLMENRLAGYEHYRNLGWLTPLFDKMMSLSVLETMGLAVVGDPNHVRKKLLELQASGLDRVSLVIGGGDLSAAEMIRTVELLSQDVVPFVAGAATPTFETALA